MDIRENKIELGIAVLAAIMIAGLFRVFGGMGADSRIETKEISYEMPRAKSDLVGEFGLDGRDIDRRYVNPFEKKNKAVDPAAAKKAAADAAAKAKQAAAAAEAAKKAAEAKKKAQTQYRVVEADRRRLTPDLRDSNPQQPHYANPELVFRKTAGQTENENRKDLLTPNQWHDLLKGQPTMANMQKLVDAVRANEIDPETFYSIAEEMLKSQDESKQKVALAGLEQVPTAGSFIVIANAQGLTGGMNDLADAILESYAAKPKHGALMGVLRSDDQVAALAAASVVMAGIKASKEGGPSTGTPRPGREQSAALNDWGLFVPIFQEWASSGEAALQGPASSILSQLNASVPTDVASF